MLIGLIEFDSEEYIETVALRYKVLREPLGLDYSKEALENDANEYHIAASQENRIIGILLLRPLNDNVVKMRQVAVHPDFQGQGIGQKLVEYSETFARNIGFETIELHAREVALKFYKSQSYSVVGNQFQEIGIPHFKMTKSI